ncbi:MFS transporter [Serratia rubidaea]|uniref:MFS transporter n=1 Tax=Serratia rubidaea TaxID=61652 RepID=UPI0022B8FD64|nr:MFS transporter [Serratia rubidaea]WBF47600.1 MFS transporter [Serratia rubidaea]
MNSNTTPAPQNHADAVPDVTIIDKSLVKRAVAAASLGNAMEWFDFGIYGYLAVTLGMVFFPEISPGAQLLSTYAAFAVAFLIRPLGGMFFGPLGDRIGRKRVLALTMIMMALGTFAIGLIPSYASIGLWAPVLLIVARGVQGFSTGGEYGGAATFIAEYAPDRKRGRLGSWLEVGTLLGLIFSAALVTAMTLLLGNEAMREWGWRVPFLIGGPLGLIGVWLRLRLEETPAFAKHMENSAPPPGMRQQWREIVTHHLRAFLLCIGMVFILNLADYMLLTWMPGYLNVVLGLSELAGLTIVVAAMLCMMVVLPFMGALSDKIGRKPLWTIGCVGFLLLTLPCFYALGSQNLALTFIGMLVMGLLLTCFLSTVASTLPALFPTAVRYGGLAIAYNLSTSLFGGTAPLLSAWLVNVTGNPLAPAGYLMFGALVGLIAVRMSKESACQPLEGSPPAIESRAEIMDHLYRHQRRKRLRLSALSSDG